MRHALRGWIALLSLGACGPSTRAAAPGSTAPAAAPSSTPAPPDHDYLVFVASEGNDRIALVRYGPAGARVERQRKIGLNPTELAGPHGLSISPDGRWYYVSTAHGTPNGALWKFSTADDAQAGRVELGRFPATVQVSPDGQYAWVVNFNLYGDMVPSSVSVVYTGDMTEVRRITTCVMPHGSRLSPDGRHQFSACMMDSRLVEIDAAAMAVSRTLPVSAAAGPACSPTWAQPSTDGATVWVACNKSNELLQIDAAEWTIRRRIPAGEGIYNLAASHDGTLIVATNKKGKSVSVFDAAGGGELARIPTSRRVPSGLVVSPDSRYAFVTQEGVGAEPGAVDVIDLGTRARVATVDVGQQAGGIDFWKVDSVK